MQRIIESNGIHLNIAEQGYVAAGDLLVLRIPETSWWSWGAHQLIKPLAVPLALPPAVAPDMRGYGKSDRPEAIDQYTIFHLLIGDLVGLLDALGSANRHYRRLRLGRGYAWRKRRACAPIASAPLQASAYRFGRVVRPAPDQPDTADRGTAQFCQLYFQQPGVAEAVRWSAEIRAPHRAYGLLYGTSGEGAAAYRAAVARGDAKTGNPGMVTHQR